MSLPDGAKRVQEALKILDSSNIVEMMPETTATAKDAADAVGVEVEQIGKSIVFDSDNVPIVAVLPGNSRVDTKQLRSLVSAKLLVRPDAEWVYKCTGYRIGGVSPFGLPEGVLVVVERDLSQYPFIYVAAGHPRAVVRVTYSELVKHTQGIEASFSL